MRLVVFKIALNVLGKIASQLKHAENEYCIPGTAVMAVFTSNAILGIVNRMCKGNDEMKL